MSGAVALIDGIWTGHHPTYVKLFAATLLGLGYRVTVLCPQPDEVRAWLEVHCAANIDRFCAHDYRDPEFHPLLPGVCRAAARWRAAAAAVGRATAAGDTPPELVFFTHLDAYFATHLHPWLVDLIFPYPWSGLYFAPERLRLHPLGLPAKRRDAALKASGCRSVALLDEGVTALLVRELSGKAVIPFPDVADLSPPDLEYPLRQQSIDKAAGRKIVGLYGCIDKRKGTLTLIEAAERLAAEPFFFVFAGVFYRQTFSEAELERIESFIASGPTNCLFQFDFIADEAAFNALVQGSDIIYAAYNSFFHSSNLLTKAAHFGKAIIVSDGYCMAERVRKYWLGEVVREADVDDCVRAIHAIADHALSCRDGKPDYDAYLSKHSMAQLQNSLAELLQRSMAGLLL